MTGKYSNKYQYDVVYEGLTEVIYGILDDSNI